MSAPSIHRNAPCTKLIGKSHSMARDATIGSTNRSGGGIGTPGRSSSGGNSAGIGLIEKKSNQEIFARDPNQKEKIDIMVTSLHDVLSLAPIVADLPQWRCG